MSGRSKKIDFIEEMILEMNHDFKIFGGFTKLIGRGKKIFQIESRWNK